MLKIKQIRLRDDSSGMRFAQTVPDYTSLQQERSTILLIHGFNTSISEADEVFKIFKKKWSNLGSRRLLLNAYNVYWPGDVRFFQLTARGVGYFKIVENAKITGRNLAEILMEQGANDPEREIIFIAHSLGCRVVLESIAILAQHDEFKTQISAYLMAAAIPYELVANDIFIQNGIKRCENGVKVFCSETDSILSRYFRIGQWLSRIGTDEKYYSEAVGLKGRPGMPPWVDIEYMRGFDHNHYWISDKVVGSIAYSLGEKVARQVRYHPSIRSRDLPSRSISFDLGY